MEYFLEESAPLLGFIKITQKGTFVTLLNWFNDTLLGNVPSAENPIMIYPVKLSTQSKCKTVYLFQ